MVIFFIRVRLPSALISQWLLEALLLGNLKKSRVRFPDSPDFLLQGGPDCNSPAVHHAVPRVSLSEERSKLDCAITHDG